MRRHQESVNDMGSRGLAGPARFLQFHPFSPFPLRRGISMASIGILLHSVDTRPNLRTISDHSRLSTRSSAKGLLSRCRCAWIMDYVQPQPGRASSSAGQGNSPEYRPHPRMPLSCVECSRRKIRCDKKIPCRACVERGDSLTCRRRKQIPTTRTRSAQHLDTRHSSDIIEQYDLRDELDRVRQRLDAVEALLGINRASNAPTDIEDRRQLVNENGLVSAMEEAAFGIGENRRWQGASLVVDNVQLPEIDHPWFTPTSLSSCLAKLPVRELSDFLVDYYCDNINWISGCLHRPSFERSQQFLDASRARATPRWNAYRLVVRGAE